VRNPVPKSGYFYPNRIARTYLQAMEEIVGRNGLNALLNLIGMQHYVDEYPPLNLDKEFDFADLSNMNRGVLDIYGVQGGRGLSQRAGRVTFDLGLKGFGILRGISNESFQTLPSSSKETIGLTALAKVFSEISDQQTRVESTGDQLEYRIDRCPVCWGQHDKNPICFLAVGIIEGALRWISGGRDHKVVETDCVAAGKDACKFVIESSSIAA
jgi:predicted hydrocarbon binding protein